MLFAEIGQLLVGRFSWPQYKCFNFWRQKRTTFMRYYLWLTTVCWWNNNTEYSFINPLKCSGVRQLHLKVLNAIQV